MKSCSVKSGNISLFYDKNERGDVSGLEFLIRAGKPKDDDFMQLILSQQEFEDLIKCQRKLLKPFEKKKKKNV